MYYDVKCPSCGKEQDINHDDGYFYDEAGKHNQDCIGCDKLFNFTISISYNYEVFCEDDKHDLELSGTGSTLLTCTNCDYYE